MKTLVLITSQFPFGTGESFIGSEFSMLTLNFDKIIIIAQNISGKKIRNIPDNVIVYRYNPSTSLLGFLLFPILFLLNCGLVFENLAEFQNALIRLIEDRELRASMGENGYEAVMKEHHIGMVKENLILLYKTITVKQEARGGL